MASSSQGMRTFGDKPKAFQLEEGGELYYVGSEVCSCDCRMEEESIQCDGC